MLLDLTLSDLKGQNLDMTNVSPLYLKNGEIYTDVLIEKVLGPCMWSVITRYIYLSSSDLGGQCQS